MAVNELAFPAAFHQPGFVQDFQVVRDGGGSNTLHGHYVPAIHAFIAGNGLKNHETSLIGQSLGNLFNLRAVHVPGLSVAKFAAILPANHRLLETPSKPMQPIVSIFI